LRLNVFSACATNIHFVGGGANWQSRQSQHRKGGSEFSLVEPQNSLFPSHQVDFVAKNNLKSLNPPDDSRKQRSVAQTARFQRAGGLFQIEIKAMRHGRM
jgi:hypothetical protein